MARKAVLERERRRAATVRKYQEKRRALLEECRRPGLSAEQRWELQLRLQALPRNSSKVRQRNRCSLTGRPRGYYRKFGLGRNKLRELAMMGEIPGLRKSSW